MPTTANAFGHRLRSNSHQQTIKLIDTELAMRLQILFNAVAMRIDAIADSSCDIDWFVQIELNIREKCAEISQQERDIDVGVERANWRQNESTTIDRNVIVATPNVKCLSVQRKLRRVVVFVRWRRQRLKAIAIKPRDGVSSDTPTTSSVSFGGLKCLRLKEDILEG
jgi:hypothetical protein